MDERQLVKEFQPEVTSSAHITTRPSLVSAAASQATAVSDVGNNNNNHPTNPVLVSAGTTDTAITQGNVAGKGSSPKNLCQREDITNDKKSLLECVCHLFIVGDAIAFDDRRWSTSRVSARLFSATFWS